MARLRLLLPGVIAIALAASAAGAVTYDDVFELTAREVPAHTIVQFIVDDGRAFVLGEDQLADLRAAGVSEIVIDAMLDPAVGEAWLEGDDFGGYSDDIDGDYSTALDRAYRDVGGAGTPGTALVYSFGYYYGPLARYYYVDPYYYPFWFAGYAAAYWPSYYAYGWRPADDDYYAYPYNWYDYSSYYCHSYYDPGYWTEIGYTVQPGAGRTVWNDGPRFRGGTGIVPPKGGRPDAVTAAYVAAGSAGRTRGAFGPPAIREAEGDRGAPDQAARTESGWRNTRVLTTPPAAATARPSGREAALAARARRLALTEVKTREDWARWLGEKNDQRAREQNERATRDWQKRLDDEARQAENEAQRRRATPPPPAERPQPREERPRQEPPRQERVPPPPPATPPAPPAPAPAPAPVPPPAPAPAPAPAEKPEKGGSGDREEAGASRGGTGRGGR